MCFFSLRSISPPCCLYNKNIVKESMFAFSTRNFVKWQSGIFRFITWRENVHGWPIFEVFVFHHFCWTSLISVLSCLLTAMSNAHRCSDTACVNHCLVNIVKNSGIVICGDHNMVQVGIPEKNQKASRHVKIKELEVSEHRRRKRCDRRRLKSRFR